MRWNVNQSRAWTMARARGIESGKDRGRTRLANLKAQWKRGARSLPDSRVHTQLEEVRVRAAAAGSSNGDGAATAAAASAATAGAAQVPAAEGAPAATASAVAQPAAKRSLQLNQPSMSKAWG